MKRCTLTLTALLVLSLAVPVAFAAETSPAADGRKWTLSTLDTSIQLAITGNHLMINELKNPAQNYNWTSGGTQIPLPAQVNSHNVTWTYADAPVDTSNGKKLTFVFTCDQVSGVSVKSIWWASSASLPGPIQHNYEVVNSTASAILLSPKLESLSIAVTSDRATSMWYFHKGSLPDKIGTIQAALGNGFSRDVITYPGNTPIPLVVLNSSDAHGLYVGHEVQYGQINVTASSGSAATIKASSLSDAMLKSLRAGNPGGSVAAKSTFVAPSVYLGVYKGDMDDGTNGLKRWFWNNKVPANMRTDPTEPWVQYGAFWAYNEEALAAKAKYWSTEKTYKKGVVTERLSNIGYEVVEIDYGWWGGNYEANPTSWPNGMNGGPLAHAAGFKFNLYFGDTVRWISREKFKQKYIEYKLDSWRNDFQVADLALLDWMAANIPNYRYETCQTAGFCQDYATYSRASVGMITDAVWWGGALRQQFYDSSWAFPPAQLSQVGHWPGWPDESYVYEMRSIMQGAIFQAHCGFFEIRNPKNYGTPADRPEHIATTAANVKLYKNSLRPLIRDGNLYHILPRPDGKNWDGIEYYNPANHKGAVMLYKPGNSGDTKTIYFKGLDSGRTYTLTFTDRPAQNTTKTGAQLMAGLNVTMTGTMVSEIILFE